MEKAFPEDGHYKVQVHVTAKKQHTMPVADIKVGKATDETDEDEKERSPPSLMGLFFFPRREGIDFMLEVISF